VFDSASAGCLPEFTESDAAAHRLVVLSPSFSILHPWVLLAQSAGCAIIGETDLGAAFWPGRLVAVTGTNGKSTVVALLSRAFRQAGHNATTAGNFGTPLSQRCLEGPTATAIAICEVSSFQAEHLNGFSAEALLWTNFAEDHIDRHGSLRGYFLAKFTLMASCPTRQTYMGSSVSIAAKKMGVPLKKGIKHVATDRARPGPGIFERLPQAGNYALARAYWEAAGMPLTALEEAAASMRALPHRLQHIEDLLGISFYNDSKATNPDAALHALKGFSRPVFWLGGGQPKGIDVKEIAREFAPLVTEARVMGQVATSLKAALQAHKVPTLIVHQMHEATFSAWEAARQFQQKSKVDPAIVLSPGFSSLDQYKNFEARGDAFIEAVFAIKASVELPQNPEEKEPDAAPPTD
jgi:UDP-N-acetylmuramoylalanine--D-glutamate ligase